MENFAVIDQPTSSVRLSIPNLNSLGVLFGATTLSEMVSSLARYQTLLKSIMSTPSVIHYDELVLLRRRAAQADLSNTSFGRAQSQLRLAVELLRLGRRSESFRLLAQIEEHLPLLSDDDELRSTATVYGIWIALVRSAAGDTDSAFAIAQRLSTVSPDSKAGGEIVNFFRGQNRQAW